MYPRIIYTDYKQTDLSLKNSIQHLEELKTNIFNISDFFEQLS